MTLLQTIIGVCTLIFVGVNFTEGDKGGYYESQGPLFSKDNKHDSLSIKMTTEVRNRMFKITCTVVKYTIPFQIVGFQHFYFYNLLVRKTSGKRVSKSTVVWTMYPYSYEDIGIYTCFVKNNITETAVTLKPILNIPPLLAPYEDQKELIMASVGDTILLNKTILPTWKRIVYWNWTDPSGRIRKGRQKDVFLQLEIHDRSFPAMGPTFGLQVYAVKEADFGTYTLKVCDIASCNTFSTVVQDRSPQHVKQSLTAGVTVSVAAIAVVVVVAVGAVTVPGAWYIYKRRQRSGTHENKREFDNAAYKNA
ncbi:uncharacterized protein LOC121390406 isoform X1 [Gigantopelta aegis]|uniref:uncharacterized protein LOC121390406 isoform X1 n=1 Tax=Gigantopelta aegis TaxID=1735272 RepID=UPI001B88C802|nr:uncharacterized protein LOC121390406 isoform X1 [Gigantopelta aegis]